MRLIRDFEPGGKRVAALGTFDGVHRAHQELLRQGRAFADAAGCPLRVYTFDRHPLEVLRPEKAPRILTTREEQMARMEKAGVEELRILPFTRETADMPPEDFLRLLREENSLAAVVAGWNYTFGRRGQGNAETLRRDGEKHGYRVIIVPSVTTDDGEIISSTAIREKLGRGDLSGAEKMLGYDYTLSGPVVNGKHQGTRIGFPTANIRTNPRKLLPAYGVYAARMRCGEKSWPAVVNIGLQPTIPSGAVTVEAHAIGASGDFYGEAAAVELKARLREEIRFGSVEELKAQIERDRAEALRRMGG